MCRAALTSSEMRTSAYDDSPSPVSTLKTEARLSSQSGVHNARLPDQKLDLVCVGLRQSVCCARWLTHMARCAL